MRKRTVKSWSVDGETKLLSTADKEGFRRAHAIVRARDFTHRRVVGYAYRAEDAQLFAASPTLLDALQDITAQVQDHFGDEWDLRDQLAALKAAKP